MSVLFEGWKVLDGSEYGAKEDEAFVELKFSLVVGQDVCKGRKTVQVDLSNTAKFRRPQKRVARLAKRKLQEYFDGHSEKNKNLFSDCFEEEFLDDLSEDQETSLRRELLEIENGYINKSA